LKAGSVLDGNYIVSGSVERLVLEWIGKRFAIESRHPLGPGFDDLLSKAGSTMYYSPENVDLFESYNLLVTLALYESDGPGDTEERSLFDRYLNRTAEALDDPNDLDVVRLCFHSLSFLFYLLPHRPGIC
jgi:hypothetical protein